MLLFNIVFPFYFSLRTIQFNYIFAFVFYDNSFTYFCDKYICVYVYFKFYKFKLFLLN